MFQPGNGLRLRVCVGICGWSLQESAAVVTYPVVMLQCFVVCFGSCLKGTLRHLLFLCDMKQNSISACINDSSND